MEEPKIELIATGKTLDTVAHELIELDIVLKKGLPRPAQHCCYLCKRRFSDISICLKDSPKEKFHSSSLHIMSYEVEVSPGIKITYDLCTECFVLVSGLAANYWQLVTETDEYCEEIKSRFENGNSYSFKQFRDMIDRLYQAEIKQAQKSSQIGEAKPEDT